MLRTLFVAAIQSFFCFGLMNSVEAVPISPRGQLFDGVPVTDSLIEGGAFWGDEADVHYWTFYGSAGDVVTITGTRLEDELDPAFTVWEGLFSDSTEWVIESGLPAARYHGFFDDEIGHTGPFGDPQAVIALPTSGIYSVFFGHVSPHGGDGLLDYQLLVEGNTVPEPSTYLMAAMGLVGLGFYGWRRKRA